MEALVSLLSFPYAYNLSKRDLYEKVIRDVMDGNAGNIHPEVYQAYSDNLRKAVGGVFSSDDYGDKYFDLQAQLQSNVSRFAAYKAYHLTEQLKKKRGEWTNDDDFKKVAKAMMNTFNRYQAAEYNTATARARTAKQWTDFNSDPIANELYPNLKWLPSRSANPREEHIPFYGLVLPKTDPFWQHNQPGNLWNCKCDWEETDDPAAPTRPDTICAKGLEGNPAETGQVFTDECTYVKNAGRHGSEIVDKFFRPIEEHHEEYVSLHNNPDYKDVDFDWKTGGVKATHKEHKTHPNDQKTYYPEKLTGDALEKEFMDKAFAKGHSVIFKKEAASETDLDMIFDGKLMDLISPTANTIHFRNQLNRKNSQLKKYNGLHNAENHSVCMYFHDPTFYTEEKLITGMEELKKLTEVQIKTVHILKNDGAEMITLEFP